MIPHDPAETGHRSAKRGRVVIELGCGNRKRYPDSIGIDRIAYDTVDIVGDIHETLANFPDGSVDLITSHHVLEHIDDLDGLMDAAARLLKFEGCFEADGSSFFESLLLLRSDP